MLILIVTPIKEEFKALAGWLDKRDPAAADAQVGRLAARRYPGLDLIVACGGLGKAQFALQVQHLIDACPEAGAVICAGTAGGLSSAVRPGDLVVATETVEHDCVYKFMPKPPPRFPADAALLSLARRAAGQALPFTVHFGAVASGDEDVVERKRAEAIRAQTGALAVAWEGAGGARACRFSNLPYLEIRGISDGSNPLALLSFMLHLGGVMGRIGELIIKSFVRSTRLPPEQGQV